MKRLLVMMVVLALSGCGMMHRDRSDRMGSQNTTSQSSSPQDSVPSTGNGNGG